MHFYQYQQPLNMMPVKMAQSPSVPRFEPIRNISSPDSRDLFRNSALDLKNRMTPTLVKSNNFSSSNTPWGSNVFLSPTYSNPDLNGRQHRFSENLGRNQTFSHGIVNVRHFGDVVTKEIPNVRYSQKIVSPVPLDSSRRPEPLIQRGKEAVYQNYVNEERNNQEVYNHQKEGFNNTPK
jgi:hypothetical protein